MIQNQGNKKIVIIIASVVLVIIAVVAGLIAYNNSPAVRLRKQLDLGNKYLAELNYEQAVAEFGKALEIMPDDTETLESLANAYIGWADSLSAAMDYEGAVGVLTKASGQLPENTRIKESLVNAYLDWADAIEATDDLDKALEILQKGFDATGDSRFSDRIDKLKEKIAIRNEERLKAEILEELGLTEQEQALLDSLYTMSIAGDYEEVALMLLSEKIAFSGIRDKFMNSRLIKDNGGSFVFFEGSNRLGLYLMDDGYFVNLYAYVGEYSEDIRNGQGVWYRIVNNTSFPEYTVGSWGNDKPEGDFEYHFFTNYPGSYSILRGKVINGRWDGEVVYTDNWPEDADDSYGDMKGYFEDGIAKPQNPRRGGNYIFVFEYSYGISGYKFLYAAEYNEDNADAIFGIPGYAEYAANYMHFY